MSIFCDVFCILPIRPQGLANRQWFDFVYLRYTNVRPPTSLLILARACTPRVDLYVSLSFTGVNVHILSSILYANTLESWGLGVH